MNDICFDWGLVQIHCKGNPIALETRATRYEKDCKEFGGIIQEGGISFPTKAQAVMFYKKHKKEEMYQWGKLRINPTKRKINV